MDSMFKGTGLVSLDLYHDPQSALKNEMEIFDETDLQKSYAKPQGKDDETVIIASRSHHIGRKIKELTNTLPLPGFNSTPD